MKHVAVGKRVPRLYGPEKVTGKTQYGAYLTLPDMVWGAVLTASVTAAAYGMGRWLGLGS